MHDTPAYSTLAGNFIVWTCILCTCSVEATLLDSILYTFWSGNKTFLNDGLLIPIILHHLIMLTLDFLAFRFYQKINDRLTDRPIDGHISKNTQVDFHNILDLASGKVPNKDTTNSCNDPRVEDDQVDYHRNRHHNFVPWRIHRQVLLCTTVASSILILAFIFISKFHLISTSGFRSCIPNRRRNCIAHHLFDEFFKHLRRKTDLLCPKLYIFCCRSFLCHPMEFLDFSWDANCSSKCSNSKVWGHTVKKFFFCWCQQAVVDNIVYV